MSYVLKYTDSTQRLGNHWFWLDGRSNHGHDAHGQAYLRWKVRPTADSHYMTHGEFNVARLHVVARVGMLPRYARYVSICGLSQCIHPDHWRRDDPLSPWRMQVLDSGVWQLVRVATNKPADRQLVVHVSFGDVVHVIAIAPLNQRSLASPRALCGVELNPRLFTVTSSPPTCVGCS